MNSKTVVRIVASITIQTLALTACSGLPGVDVSGSNIGYNRSGGTNAGGGGTIINCNESGACVTSNGAQPSAGNTTSRCYGADKPNVAGLWLTRATGTELQCAKGDCRSALDACSRNELCAKSAYFAARCHQSDSADECDSLMELCFAGRKYDSCVVACRGSGHTPCLWDCLGIDRHLKPMMACFERCDPPSLVPELE